MTSNVVTYLLFKRPQDGAGNVIYGPMGGGRYLTDGTWEAGETVYVKNATGALSASYDECVVKDGDAWLHVATANSIEGILEAAQVVSRDIGVGNIKIVKEIGVDQKINLA